MQLTTCTRQRSHKRLAGFISIRQVVSRAILKFVFGQKNLNPWLNNLCADLHYLVATQLEGGATCYLLTNVSFFLKKLCGRKKLMNFFFKILAKLVKFTLLKKKSPIFFQKKQQNSSQKKKSLLTR
jgi:hypothetical protein